MEKIKKIENNGERIFIVDEEQTIISFIKKTFLSTPLSLIYKLFRSKKIKINDNYIRNYNFRVKSGQLVLIKDDKVLLNKKPIVKKKAVDPEVKFEIIYEDKNIMIVVKDHNVETHNKINPEKSLDNAVFHYLLTSGWDSSSDSFLMSSSHRLDKVTKGLVVYPKNSIAKKILHNSFGNKNSLRKKYLAVCENKKNKKIPSSINGFIYKDDQREKMIFHLENNENKNSKSCSMKIEEVCKKDYFSVFDIDLETGRKHQIRSILSYLGFPVIGDRKYDSSFPLDSKIKLFAYKIEFLNLPGLLSYLNGRKFEIENLKEKITLQINSVSENLLPKKFLKY
jgi:23S rRNA pseudouridine955/2504/2580 synthase